jgi:glucose-6-phosphate dehydrogenase assembly protein OpcA
MAEAVTMSEQASTSTSASTSASASTASANVERFSRGEAISVEVDRIEKELAALWQAAGRSPDSGDLRPISRAALWNLVIPARGADSMSRVKRLIDELAPSMPARVITLCRGWAHTLGGITATIESNVVSRPGGVRLVFAEEITLTGEGADADERHFGALVRSLQIPSLPTATLWIDSTSVESLLTNELLPVSDRLVIDTGRCMGARDLAAICRLGTVSRAEVGDLGWLRLAGFRLLFAGLFDPPVGGGPLLAARHIEIEYRSPRLASALLLTAWLGCQLGWRPVNAEPAADKGVGIRLRFAGTAERREAREPTVTVDLRPAAGECGTSGIVSISLEAGSEAQRYGVRRTADNHAEISVPIAPSHTVKLDSRSDAELCVGALGPGGRDPLLRRVLPYAERLADLVAARGAG